MSFCLRHQFQVVAGISVFFICTSVISFCLKTLPGLRVEIPITLNHTSSNSSEIYPPTTLPSSTTEANFITASSTYRSTGLFNRYSVSICNVVVVIGLVVFFYAWRGFLPWAFFILYIIRQKCSHNALCWG